MAIFNKTVITEKGYSLIAKSILNNSKINFTKIVASDYDYSKLSEEDIEQLEALEDIKQSVLVNDVKVINESTVNVSGILSNTELKEEYYLRAIGLFAADPQENKEILYSITVAKEADCFPSFDGNNVSNVLLDLETIISKSSKIDLEVNPNATATIKNLNDLENKINEKVEDITTHLNENTQNIENLQDRFSNFKFYDGRQSINIEFTQTTPITTIVKTMNENSILIDATAGENNNVYPTVNGLLIIIKQKGAYRNICKWYNQQGIGEYEEYIGYVDNNNWSGWKQLATTETTAFPTLLNGWTQSMGCSISKVGNIVTISGLITAGVVTMSTELFTIPEGFRPSITRRFPLLQQSTNYNGASVNVQSNGTVKIDADTGLSTTEYTFINFTYGI